MEMRWFFLFHIDFLFLFINNVLMYYIPSPSTQDVFVVEFKLTIYLDVKYNICFISQTNQRFGLSGPMVTAD